MTQRHLILISLALFAAGSAFLFWQNERELDPDRGQNWWTLSFASPQEQDNLSFVVENHSDNTHFDYTIIADKKILAEGSFAVEKGSSVTIRPDFRAKSGVRTSIVVTDGKENKEIYQ